ncbi:hypothetical protein NUU61_001336 [Penicillium alfredii]|uniref:Uncharacterized protein n=1 Tax=Penicillium alfredii TaxID=1506179 RepID=A0A9W9KN65_9EURO|nr:uncharacterized protein NUU61_001336 [Penicillium alfredii]KAJ5111706.1 hypothetical protein NUU61_001336 [Penicillium alfredii]
MIFFPFFFGVAGIIGITGTTGFAVAAGALLIVAAEIFAFPFLGPGRFGLGQSNGFNYGATTNRKIGLAAYLAKINVRESDECTCGPGRETIEYVLIECDRWEDERHDLRFDLFEKDMSMSLGCEVLLSQEPSSWCEPACWGSSAGVDDAAMGMETGVSDDSEGGGGAPLLLTIHFGQFKPFVGLVQNQGVTSDTVLISLAGYSLIQTHCGRQSGLHFLSDFMIMGGIAQSQAIFGLGMKHQLITGETALFFAIGGCQPVVDSKTHLQKLERPTMTTIGW